MGCRAHSLHSLSSRLLSLAVFLHSLWKAREVRAEGRWGLPTSLGIGVSVLKGTIAFRVFLQDYSVYLKFGKVRTLGEMAD